MKLKDLFIVIIKVFGFFIIKDIIATFPYLISPVAELMDSETRQEGMTTLILTLLVLGFYFWIAYMLLFKTNSIINFLKLEPEFMEDHLSFSISTKNVLTIALILLSGYLLIDEIPNFCKYLFAYYEQTQVRFTTTKPPISNLLVSGIKILLAFLIIGERKQIIQFVRKDEVIQQEE